MDEGHKFVFFVFVFVFVFLHLISKDSFIVPEVRIVFYKMHSDFQILQIQISISLIRHHGIFNFWRTTGKPSSIYENICTMYLFRHRIFWWKRVIIYRSWAFFLVSKNIRGNWISEPRVAVLTVTSPQGSPQGVTIQKAL